MHFYGSANNSAEKCFKRIIKYKRKARVDSYLDKRRTGRTPCNFLDADMYIILLLNFCNHLNIARNNESKYVSMKGMIVHRKNNPIMVTMIIIKRYMHLWHECLVMTKVLVEILVTVLN